MADLIEHSKDSPDSKRPDAPEKSKSAKDRLFDLAKRISDDLNSEQMQGAREGLRKLGESLRTQDESLRDQLTKFAESTARPQTAYHFENETKWAAELSEREDARYKAIVADAIDEYFKRKEERDRNQPKLGEPRETTPPERFLELYRTPAGHMEIRIHPTRNLTRTADCENARNCSDEKKAYKPKRDLRSRNANWTRSGDSPLSIRKVQSPTPRRLWQRTQDRLFSRRY